MNNPQRKTGSATDNRYLSATHEVINQPRPLENYNLYEQDTALAEAARRDGATDREQDLVRFGRDVEKAVLARGLRWHLEDRVLIHGNKTVVFA